MIDIRALREDPDAVKAALARRGVEASEVDAVLEADVGWRAKAKEAEDLRAEVKALRARSDRPERAVTKPVPTSSARGAGPWATSSRR